MCLIIKTDEPSKLSLNLLETAYNNNSDGFGVMFCNKGKLHTQKIVPKTLFLQVRCYQVLEIRNYYIVAQNP